MWLRTVYYSHFCKENISQIFITTLYLIIILLQGKFSLFRRAWNRFMLILSQSVFTVHALCTFNIQYFKVTIIHNYLYNDTFHKFRLPCKIKSSKKWLIKKYCYHLSLLKLIVLSNNYLMWSIAFLKIIAINILRLDYSIDVKYEFMPTSQNRPYSYSRYWTRPSMQWRFMRGNVIKKEINSICTWKDSPASA